MAKRKASVNELPGQSSTDDPVEQKVVESVSSTVAGCVNIEIPVFSFDGYSRRRVDVTFSGDSADGWKAVLHGLERQEAKLANGKYVSNVSDAVRWVGESINSQLSK